VSTLQDYFEILKRAGSPVEDQDKVFHFLKGLPVEFEPFKIAVDVLDSTGTSQTFEDIVRSFQTYLQRNSTKEQSMVHDSQSTLFSHGFPAVSDTSQACRNFLAGKCSKNPCRYSHAAGTGDRWHFVINF